MKHGVQPGMTKVKALGFDNKPQIIEIFTAVRCTRSHDVSAMENAALDKLSVLYQQLLGVELKIDKVERYVEMDRNAGRRSSPTKPQPAAASR